MIDSACYPRLSRVQTPDDLRTFDETELGAVAGELRAYLIESVGKSGGHFAAGLGVIELTVALHYLFNTPVDQLVWDVGHQTYPHKILTGRRDSIHTVKQKDGVAPFPKREESEYDTFGVGHSSTSISAALGMAIARQRQGDDRKVVAVIGDGAMTAGMAFEALAHAGGMDDEPNVLVVLNDNNMSISEAVGGLTKMLGRATASRTLNALREGGKKILGDKHSPPARFVKRWEEQWKGMFVPSTAFEQMGFHYTGPIDGHDLPLLLSTLKRLKDAKGPQLLHIMTTKGKGYEPAEDDQIGYHAVGPFDPSKGLPTKSAPKKPTYTDIFGDWLCDAAAAEPQLLGITPAMREGSGLVRFSKEYPERYFDVAIAEQHAVTLAAGMATQGAKPVVAIYSTFLQRAYDQLVHDVAVQELDVLFAIDRAGVVGPDGATHAGNLDLSFLRCVPHMVVMAPGDEAECRQMLSTGLQYNGPAAVRYPRGTGPGAAVGTDLSTLEIGKAQLRHQGSRIAILAFGSPLSAAEQVGRELGLSVVNMRFIKPLDKAMLLELARTHEGFVTVEDNVVAGGAGSGVSELLNTEAVLMPVLHLGLPDSFQHHASREDLLAEAGIDAAGIRESILKRWPKLKDNATPLSAAS
ncbi:1-deoxy-D-xylulose-5-phosphate synthase [Stenotrophomonas humi]|uniref:1-deoxy-D-xylulose-5-phosphate synthase n=1 Tax=Stenotrophomonas humi TaxID=405444 RepID=A0A0R0CFG3_9GAMM|nr:1-deoxy-D-xylulose-5-phosphate synthase [Stenotrophomonas humi]KRG63848.1 1-deoxy-D-xylulose-5-phosphate synthase [Stenotrophomonas humi]